MINPRRPIENEDATSDLAMNSDTTTQPNDRRAMYERIARGHTLEAAESDARRKWRGH